MSKQEKIEEKLKNEEEQEQKKIAELPKKEAKGIDKSFLVAYYSETQEEMRWRREVEFKLMTIMLSVDTILFGVFTLVIQSAKIPHDFVKLIGIIISGFIFVLSACIIAKIIHDNKIYKKLGSSVANLLSYSNMNDSKLLVKGWTEYGQGNGFKFTNSIISIICIATIIGLLLISFAPQVSSVTELPKSVSVIIGK